MTEATISALLARITDANRLPSPAAGPVVVGLSGGVDSGTTAWVLRKLGYDVIGITAHLYGGAIETDPRSGRGCCSLPGSEDARRVAAALQMPFYVLNLEKDFRQHVLDPFAGMYLAGETPNPCVECNRGVKFDVLLRKARDLGAHWLATGHYARIVATETGSLALEQATDPDKDQSYFLYFLDSPLLAHLGFPLGSLTKAEVRTLAAAARLPVANKPESQDLCFAPDGDYAAVVDLLRPGSQNSGPILDQSGTLLGEHRGLVHYTVGQRKGLGLAAPEPLFVLEKDVARNALIVGPAAACDTREVWLREVVRTDGGDPATPYDCELQPRYRGPRIVAHIEPLEGRRARVTYATPGPLPAPGQVAVAWQGRRVVGGGRFDVAWRHAPPLVPAGHAL
ncbi:MAG: tRNA-specific 2-thiouridylase MnmA [bacterium]|nr:tRNA-specific 2-thiouridylase MnmA [bacterium]